MEAVPGGYGGLGPSAVTLGVGAGGGGAREVGAVRVALRSGEYSGLLRRRRSGVEEGAPAPPVARCVGARAASLRGLGETLQEGYVLKNHGVVDENTTVESTGDVIEKLKNGFKNFKTTQYK